MPEKVVPGPVADDVSIREAVCIHTRKIFDSCKDKDCIEDLRVYPTRASQDVLAHALSVKPGCAQLLSAYIDVEPVSFNRGFYTVDVRYFYRITADAFVGAARPVEVSGLAVFDKRVILFGSEGSAKVFSSDSCMDCACCTSMPTAVVEAVDPIILNVKLADMCDCGGCDCGMAEVPACICSAFGGELVFGGDCRRMYVSLGQFSIIRLERDTQLLMPAYDYCLPDKECPCGSDDDPCEIFRHVKFPVDEFFPPNTACSCADNYKDFKCGCQG
ncbi:MAG: hypothetical protein IJP02_00930 [Oscillospiraceae bacterium]|nr:hypothetical protein [Oscillospiraceae bacterium]